MCDKFLADEVCIVLGLWEDLDNSIFLAFGTIHRSGMGGFDEEFREIRKQMERIFRDFFPNRILQIPGEAWRPAMDIYETEKDLTIIVELAGAVPENLRIFFEREVLKISGTRESLANLSCTKCHQMEIDFGSFQKEIHIPFEVDKDNASSHHEDGLLKIRLPKARRTLKKPIEISLK